MASVDTLLNQLRYTNRARVKADMDKLAREYKTLIPRAVDYVHDNGSQSRLIVLSGTIPIFYNSVQYNIPVDLFLTITYPSEPPKLYVRPTPNMTVKANHRHVSPDGLCYLPYLAEWTTHSDLNGLVEIASSVFSIEPPLFTKPPGGSAVSSPTNSATVVSPPSARSAYGNYAQPAALAHPSTAANTNTANTSNAYTNNSSVHSTYENYASPTSSSSSVYSPASTATPGVFTSASSFAQVQKETEADKKAQLIDQVSMRMYEEIDRKQRILRDELDTEIALSSTLSKSADQATLTLRNLQACNKQYTQALEELTKQSEEFDLWNADQANQTKLSAEDRAVPLDALSAQIVRLHSEVNAIDDAFYHLERALASSKNHSVDLNTFLKECRQLARKQFLSKAHLKKINAECMQQEAEQAAAQARAQASLRPIEHAPQHQTQAYPQTQTHPTYPLPQLPPHSIQTQPYAQAQYQQPPPVPTHAISSGPPLVPRAAPAAAYPRHDGVSAVAYPGAGAVAGRY